jgi:hypothetical protein
MYYFLALMPQVAMDAAGVFERAASLLEYGIAGILVLTLLLWFLERRETTKRFERVMKETAKADLAVAKALVAVQTILLTHGWNPHDPTDD